LEKQNWSIILGEKERQIDGKRNVFRFFFAGVYTFLPIFPLSFSDFVLFCYKDMWWVALDWFFLHKRDG